MKTDARRKKIIELLQTKKTVSTLELSSIFQVTTETIRKDLTFLHETGEVIRTHGGAMLYQNSIEYTSDIRNMQMRKEKKAIAKAAAQFIKDNDYIFIDNGSTVARIVEHLTDHKNLTVATNSLPLANQISKLENVRLLLAGGSYRKSSMSFSGMLTEEQVLNFRVPKAFMSCTGLDLEYGIMDGNEEENRVKQQIFKTAKEIYLLVDHSKFTIRTYNFLSSVENVTAVITDSGLSQAVKEAYLARGINIIICDP